MRAKKSLFFNALSTKASFLFLIIFSLVILPSQANASLLSFLGFGSGPTSTTSSEIVTISNNSQTFPLPEANIGISLFADGGKGGGDVLVDDGALVADGGPLGTEADLSSVTFPETDQISLYIVHKGDTLSTIAQMFGVSANTICWANNLSPCSRISPGDTLLILPITGVNYTIKKGDTLQSIAKTFKADSGEIGKFNGLEADSALIAGTTIIIPDGELATKVSPSYTSSSSLPALAWGATSLKAGTDKVPNYTNYYIRPIKGGVRTQGLHGWNAVDLGAPIGTPILAAANGTVLVSRNSGWNGGYGNYVVLSHPNGTETVYGHMLRTTVSVGETVYQGEQIGLLGQSGRATGPHVHFEIRGARNELGYDSNYGL